MIIINNYIFDPILLNYYFNINILKLEKYSNE